MYSRYSYIKRNLSKEQWLCSNVKYLALSYGKKISRFFSHAYMSILILIVQPF